MFLKKKSLSEFESESLSKQTWRRFKKDKLAMTGLVLIVIATLISILGYAITPDSTPFANDQKPELHIKEPGFNIDLLLMRKNEMEKSENIFTKMFFGVTGKFTTVPVYEYTFEGANIIVEEFTGNTPNNGGKTPYNIADVVYDVNPNTNVKFDEASQTLEFYVISTGEKMKKCC
ncbi:MAG: hypothetical protein IPJ32_03870 [Sphingobacteriaceae bacterium]|nr:hypothetical protein [Sphingobacteriaceae bacterium]